MAGLGDAADVGALRALYDACRTSSGKTIAAMKEEISAARGERDDCRAALARSEGEVALLRSQLEGARAELEDARRAAELGETEAENLRLQRDSALEVQTSLSNMVESRDAEIERLLNGTIENLRSQLETAIEVRCDELVKCNNAANSLERAPERVDAAERAAALKSELEKCSAGLIASKTNFKTMKINLERQLAKKTDEINLANAKISKLCEAKDNLAKKIDSLNKIVSSQNEREEQLHEEYKVELVTKTKLVETYKKAQSDLVEKNERLMTVNAKLEELARETTANYEESESKLKKTEEEHEEALRQKNKRIDSLKRELENANELLHMTDADHLSSAMEDLSPAANVASKFIRSKMSLTQAFDQVVQLSDELLIEKNENKKLKHTVTSIVSDLEKRVPYLDEQKLRYDESLENNALLQEKLENLMSQFGKLKQENVESEKSRDSLRRENDKLKSEIEDLGRQIRFLLKEIEIKRGRYTNYDDDGSFSLNDSEATDAKRLINKTLITYRDIDELQSNNQKLLRVVKELTEKHEAAEESENNTLKSKLELLENKLAEYVCSHDRQVKMINSLAEQRDAFKKLCEERSTTKKNERMEVDDSTESLEMSKMIDEKIQRLETQLEDANVELCREREKFRQYVEKMNKKELSLIENNDIVSKQLNDLRLTHNKCALSSRNLSEKLKTMEVELSSCKKKNSLLEEKISSYASLIVKQKSSIKHISENISKSGNSLSSLIATHCSQSNRNSNMPVLIQSVCSLSEVEQKQPQNLYKDIELIKNAILGEDFSIQKTQETLEDVNKTCTILRCMLQEEQEKYQNFSCHFNQEIEQYKTALNNEKTEIENLKNELSNAQQEIQSKSKLVEELKRSKPSTDFRASSDVKTEEVLKNRELQLDEYKIKLENSEERIRKIESIYKESENKFQTLTKVHDEYKESTEETIQLLNAKCQDFERLLLQKENKINVISLELHEKKEELNVAIFENNFLIKETEIMGSRSSREIASNSNDYSNKIKYEDELARELSIVRQKEERLDSQLHQNIEKLYTQADEASVQLKALTQQEHVNYENQLQILQAFREKIDNGSQMRYEITNIENAENVYPNMLVHIYKINELLHEKYRMMQEENSRLKTQLEISEQKKSSPLSDENVHTQLTLFKNDLVLQKVGKFNAVSESYMSLHERTEELKLRFGELSENYRILQDSLVVKEQEVLELKVKIDSLQSENETYKNGAEKWKNRVTSFLDKSNQNCPDDWKKIQIDYENLNKLLTNERENLETSTREIERMKIENSSLEEQIQKLHKQNASVNENFKKKLNELNLTKKENERIQQELTDAKSALDKKSTENSQINEKLTNNETALADIRNKELQIRKIAKRYKTQYEELIKTSEEEKKKTDTLVSETTATSENRLEACKELEQRTLELEKAHSEKITKLNNQISTITEENKKLTVEVESLRSSLQEKEEKTRQILKQAKLKITSLTDSKESLVKELAVAKDQITSFEQNKDENDVRLQVIKSQYDGRLAKIEKEKSQSMQEKQNEIVQLNRQIESLLLKVSQLQRRTDNYQNPKPSTSTTQGDKSNTDPPTANIKPMAGVSSPRDVGRRPAGETPLASIKPMASHSGVRTAAILPTTAQVQSHTHHQAPHTTGNIATDTMSSTPSSSHIGTEFMPTSSSVSGRLMQQLSRHVSLPPPESTQDMDMVTSEDNDASTGSALSQSTSQSLNVSQTGSQQAVALVLPRIETTSTEHQSSHHQQQASSSSGSNSSSTVTTSHGPITSGGNNSNKGEVTRAFKRPHTGSSQLLPKTILKRSKTQVYQRVTEYEADYQVPTSSQRDQEDDVNFPDSEDDDTFQDRIYEIDDENEIEEDKDVSRPARSNEEAISNENRAVSRSSEAEFADNNSVQENSRNDDSSRTTGSIDAHVERPVLPNIITSPLQEQQIETISSGNGIDSSFLMNSSNVTSAVVTAAYEEGDDGIVPSTPTLYVPTRNDGFGEAVRSPMTRGLASSEGRFTFNENSAGTSGVMDDTHPDLAPQLTPHNHAATDNAANVSMVDNSVSLGNSEVEVERCSYDSNVIDDESPTVSSQTTSNFTAQVSVEEGREAEASTTASVNTPPRASGHGVRGAKPIRRGVSTHVATPRPTDHQRPPPIVWTSDGSYRRNYNQPRAAQRGARHGLRRTTTYYKRF